MFNIKMQWRKLRGALGAVASLSIKKIVYSIMSIEAAKIMLNESFSDNDSSIMM